MGVKYLLDFDYQLLDFLFQDVLEKRIEIFVKAHDRTKSYEFGAFA